MFRYMWEFFIWSMIFSKYVVLFIEYSLTPIRLVIYLPIPLPVTWNTLLLIVFLAKNCGSGRAIFILLQIFRELLTYLLPGTESFSRNYHFSDSQKIPHIFWNPKFHYISHMSPPSVPNPKQDQSSLWPLTELPDYPS